MRGVLSNLRIGSCVLIGCAFTLSVTKTCYPCNSALQSGILLESFRDKVQQPLPDECWHIKKVALLFGRV